MPKRVNIVGAGIMGLCAAWALNRRGYEVCVFEQHRVPNPLGSSVDQHRLIRHPYGAQAGYTRMIDEAYQAWDRLWSDLGRRLYVPTGTLVLAIPGRDAWLQASFKVLTALGYEIKRLSNTTVASRFPMLDAEKIEDALYVPTGGVLLAERIVQTLAEFLKRKGVILRTGMHVAGLDPQRSTVSLENGHSFEADAVVVCAGPWVTRLLPQLGGACDAITTAVHSNETAGALPRGVDAGADGARHRS